LVWVIATGITQYHFSGNRYLNKSFESIRIGIYHYYRDGFPGERLNLFATFVVILSYGFDFSLND
jgi:hypothetical protein